MQQGDVKLYQTTDGGEINIVDGVAEMSGGLETAAYLSLFGGNEDAARPYWGNLLETAKSRKVTSETQSLIKSLPLTSNNLLRVKDAARRDLQWMIDERVASSVTVSVSIPALNTLGVTIGIEAEGLESTFNFVENWKA